VASTVIVLILIGLTYYRLPWRKLPDAGGARVAPPPVVEPSIPAPQPAKPSAYAESP
jgi:alpha-1,6-mannosyltransferase